MRNALRPVGVAAAVLLIAGCGGKTTPVDLGPDVDCEAELNRTVAAASPPDKNAAARLLEALGPDPGGVSASADFCTWLGVKPPPDRGEYWRPKSDFFADELAGDDGQAFLDGLDRRQSRPWTAKDQPRHAAWLAANAKAFERVKAAAESPAYFQPVVARLPDGRACHLLNARLVIGQPSREMALALLGRAMLNAGEGRTEEAWADVLTVYRLALQFTRGTALLEYLVGVGTLRAAAEAAFTLLDVGGPVASPAAARFREFLTTTAIPTPAAQFDAYPHFCRDIVQHFRKYGRGYLDAVGKDVDLADADLREPDATERKKLDALDWQAVARPCAENAEALAAAFRLPAITDQRKRIEDIMVDVEKAKRRLTNGVEYEKADGLSERCGILLLGLLSQPGHRFHRSYSEAEQRQRVLRVTFVLAAYRADCGGYPESLDAVVPKYLPAVPADVHSDGQPVYRRTADGYELYGVGANGVDDGGRTYGDDPPGDDIVVRLPRTAAKK